MPLPDPAIVTGGALAGPARVSPQAGMSYPVTASADPTGKIVIGGVVLVGLPSAQYVSGATIATFSTQYIQNMAWDFTVSSVTGGTATVTMQRQGADGNWYPVFPVPGAAGNTFSGTVSTYTSLDVSASASESVGATAPWVGSTHNISTLQAQIVTSGSFGTITTTMSVIGR